MHRQDSIDTSHSKASNRASIVVVDPDPVSLIALAGVLDTQGYSCICARTAAAAQQALTMGIQDLIVWDVADGAQLALDALAAMRATKNHQQLTALFLADSQWAGLEKKAEKLSVATRCLFKPIDPNVLLAVVHEVLWMPSLVQTHRRRGSRPSRPGWVTL